MDAIPIVANPEIVVGAPDNKQLQETSCILEIDLENGVVPSAPEAISNNETSEKPKSNAKAVIFDIVLIVLYFLLCELKYALLWTVAAVSGYLLVDSMKTDTVGQWYCFAGYLAFVALVLNKSLFYLSCLVCRIEKLKRPGGLVEFIRRKQLNKHHSVQWWCCCWCIYKRAKNEFPTIKWFAPKKWLWLAVKAVAHIRGFNCCLISLIYPVFLYKVIRYHRNISQTGWAFFLFDIAVCFFVLKDYFNSPKCDECGCGKSVMMV